MSAKTSAYEAGPSQGPTSPGILLALRARIIHGWLRSSNKGKPTEVGRDLQETTILTAEGESDIGEC